MLTPYVLQRDWFDVLYLAVTFAPQHIGNVIIRLAREGGIEPPFSSLAKVYFRIYPFCRSYLGIPLIQFAVLTIIKNMIITIYKIHLSCILFVVNEIIKPVITRALKFTPSAMSHRHLRVC